jgi:pyruvate formate lyase activating enzyme
VTAPATRPTASGTIDPAAVMTGVVFDVERTSTHDGPGIRTTVFLKGCYLRCAWCQNPESMHPRPELSFDATRCLACLECYAACSTHCLYLIDTEGEPVPVDELPALCDNPERIGGRVHESSSCVRCGACTEACYAGALQVVGAERSVDEVLEEVLADRAFYESSGGGVTLSGGEPLFQSVFAGALLSACRGHGLHTALDTTAFGHWEPLERLLQHTDLVLLDLKAMDPSVHKAFTGVDNASILRNARAMGRLLGERPESSGSLRHGVWVRVPVIPGVNDDEANLRATARFVRDDIGPAVKAVELLGYHTLGTAKLERLGREGAMEDVPPMTRAELAQRAAIVEHELKGSGIAVRQR